MVVLLAVALGVLPVLAFVVISAIGLWMYANHDHIDLLDDPRVVDRAESACATMTRRVDQAAVAPTATRAARIAAIHDQDRAVTAMVDDIRGLGSEPPRGRHPSAGLADGLGRLVAAREAYAGSLTAGHPAHLAVTQVDGRPITHRMNEVGLTCQVPTVLTALPPVART